MPTSNYKAISLLLDAVNALRPSSVLDIGVRMGKYGVLCREYLDELWIGGLRSRIDGIEAFEKYLTPVHSYVYDKIYIGDALEVLPKMERRYEPALLIDVFEHFDRAEGAKLLHLCNRVAESILMSVPAGWSSQDALHGNTYEIHRAGYSWRDLRSLGFSQCWRINGGSYIALKSSKKVSLRRTILRLAVAGLLPLPLGDPAAVVARWLGLI